MEPLQLMVRMNLNAWDAQIKRASSFFNGLSDEELYQEIAPGKNRAIYLLGHLVAIHDGMLSLLGIGNRDYEQLDNAFVKSPDKAVEHLPEPKDLRAYWTNVNDILNRQFNSLLAEEWLHKHTAVSEADFEKEPHRNRLNVLISRTNHLAYHLGQLVLIKK